MVEAVVSISARPPTPPRTTSCALSNTATDERERPGELLPTFQTPGDSPFSTNGSQGALSSRHSKRVNFSPWTKYIKPPTFSSSVLKPMADLKVLPPSNECKPAKSILKTTNSAVAPVSLSQTTPYTSESFVMLLESALRELAGEAPSGRLDAYMHLLGALKAYDGLPTAQEISGNLVPLTQYIQRDATRKLENGGPIDSNLVIQALKLSIALVWHPEISAQLPDDFKTFLVDYSITALHEAKASKSILVHHLHILSTQNFSVKIMTNARITRLLTVLHDITSRVSGNAAVFHRLSTYQRILSQSKGAFLAQSSLWMEHLISGLLHHIKDTRLKAISLGFQISTTFGPSPILSKTIRDILDRPIEKTRKLVTEVCERMSRMMASLESGVHVPQIWSIIILLVGSKKLSVDQWEHFKEWVLVLQKCFNCSESAIKAQAIIGWNRFVYVVALNEATSSSVLKMLSKPIMSQFDRKKQDKSGTQPSQLALSSYYNLLYYAFRPSVSHQRLDVVWDEYVAVPSSTILISTPALSDRVSQVLAFLLWSPQAKVWSESRINETNKLVPDELPSIDYRWTRTRITSILKVFENLLKSSTWNDEAPESSNISTAWTSLSKALSNASSKEITPSTESMQAVASVLGFLQRLWIAGPSALNASGDRCVDKFFDRFRFLSVAMIVSTGSISFTEKLLLKTGDESFQAANTPTHRHPRPDTKLDIPILHFLRFVSDVSGISEPVQSYVHLIDGTLEAACIGKVSRGSRLEFLRQCADLVPNEPGSLDLPTFTQIVWKTTAKLAVDCLCSCPIESARERDGTVARDYDNLVKILDSGLQFPDASREWGQLLDSFVRVLRTERGDWAIATMIIEPLAERVVRVPLQNAYKPSTALLHQSLSIPFFHHNKANGQETINNTASSSPLNQESLLFPHNLANLAEKTLQQSYEQFKPSETAELADFIESLTSLLGSGALAFRSAVLETLQQPLGVWLEDETHQLTPERGVESRILTAYRALSSAILNILQTSIPHDTLSLRRFETITYSGLESSHVYIAKRFIEMWNSSFGLQEKLEYPERVLRALRKLEPYTKVKLPGLSPSKGLQPNLPKSILSNEQSKAGKDGLPRKVLARTAVEDSFDSSASTGFNSSPVTREDGLSSALQLRQSTESAVVSSGSQPEPVPISQAMDDFSPMDIEPRQAENQVHEDMDRKNIFTMIEGLRSSPATSTPGNLGFRTPPHLRILSNLERSTGTPLTPTIAAVSADLEDNFLGSSPTPGTRSHVPTPGSSLSVSLPISTNQSLLDEELPSSPPEFQASNSKRRKKKTRASVSVREINSLNENTVNGNVVEPSADDETEDNERTPTVKPVVSSRRRSQRKSIASNEPTETPKGESSNGIVPEAKSSSKIKGSMSKKSAKKIAPPVLTDDFDGNSSVVAIQKDDPDSSSDDMEMQIASQLENDMSLMNRSINEDMERPVNPVQSVPSTRKRKRQAEEAMATPEANKSRSSKAIPITEPTTANAKSDVSTAISEQALDPISVPEVSPSKTTKGTKRRKMQKTDSTESTGVAVLGEKSQEQVEIKHQKSKQSPKKRRRSARLDPDAASPVKEEQSTRKRSQRGHRKQDALKANKQSPSRELYTEEQREPQLEEEASVVEETQLDHNSTLQEDLVQDDGDRLGSIESEMEQNYASDHVAITMVAEDLDPETEPANAIPDDVEMGDAQPENHDTQVSFAEEIGGLHMGPPTSKPTGETIPPGTQVSGSNILDSLRKILGDVKKANFGREALREIDDLLFDIRVEMHEASKRHVE
ncbi:hypothetical protein ASPZODRAFT_144509 [Penicilliopsis zonata CBS 506.65]|uniref:Telomere-associated protein Rif1 N-terminal domain-containing protein n=1 Tax=Penicilliopsis zonata CBS 506.65 TaxID=1073090 RepID=A0A1L9SBN3_9EURO|nr:hypothetical protein ASPZODRAFT_144509 [Penicilliopsis zonata CBS 506.65]OJJ44539.1 hypothetical protein ASPZODRAFT_144509 [Penicilliopsis zonata CBS 506.65]